MKTLLVAALLATCTVAVAAADPKPVTAGRCQPSGTPIFESKLAPRQAGGGPTETRAIYGDGAFTLEATDKDGKSTQHVTGVCIDHAQLDAAKAALKGATWKVTTARVKCMAMSNQVTTYSASGKDVFVETLCSGKSLDTASADSLAKLKDILKGPTAK
jgi:hypothetical protein